MPRSRRKHHSRSRSRSHSHDKDRDAKRRKIEQFDSPNHKRSVRPPIDPTREQEQRSSPTSSSKDVADSNVVVLSDSADDSTDAADVQIKADAEVEIVTDSASSINSGVERDFNGSSTNEKGASASDNDAVGSMSTNNSSDLQKQSSGTPDAEILAEIDYANISDPNITPVTKKTADANSKTHSEGSKNSDTTGESTPNSVKRLFIEKTPNRRLTPKQLEKKLESEKRRQQKEKEKEERERQKQLEKEQKDKEREERERQKQSEKEQKEAEKQKKKEMKQKEIEQKQKEKEEKEEQRRQEKELKLKQKEEERLRKQQEIDEKNREKLKEEEKKQKAAAAFVSFFVPKKGNDLEDKRPESTSLFLPFEVKCDMKLPPLRRKHLTCDEILSLEDFLQHNKPEYSYLNDLKSSHRPRSCPRTWINRENDDDIILVGDEEVLGETICELKPKTEKMKVKLLQFHENQRPAYYGTWRKKSKNITGRKPWGKEDLLDYDVDSDDDWEEEEQGENLEVISDDEKENEPENDDYEVDNEFFVPHGHLSDDEVDDEEHARLSPESQKQKLKLLKDAFDSDIKSKTQKIKPRSIGCVWYNKDGNNVEEAIDNYLQPLNVIINCVIKIKKRDVAAATNPKKKKKMPKPLPDNHMRALAKIVQGNVNKREKLVDEFLGYIKSNNVDLELSKANISKQISLIAKWTHNIDGKTHCWVVNEDVAGKFNMDSE